MTPIGLATIIAKLAAESSTHAHCIQSDYEEMRDQLVADGTERADAERDALEYVRKKFTHKAAHRRRIAMRPAP
jgi:hypothetical protein